MRQRASPVLKPGAGEVSGAYRSTPIGGPIDAQDPHPCRRSGGFHHRQEAAANGTTQPVETREGEGLTMAVQIPTILVVIACKTVLAGPPDQNAAFTHYENRERATEHSMMGSRRHAIQL